MAACFTRSPIGRIFVEHLGEAVFRNDLDNSVLELGDLLTHEGPALAAQKDAAQIFGAERTYFVLNGTSASNKIALTALITGRPGALRPQQSQGGASRRVADRRWHSDLSTDAAQCPRADRADRFRRARRDLIRDAIRDNQLVTDPKAWQRERPFRAAVIEQCTYDGTIYGARQCFEQIGHLCDYILFDEAWAGFMKFHPLFAGVSRWACETG